MHRVAGQIVSKQMDHDNGPLRNRYSTIPEEIIAEMRTATPERQLEIFYRYPHSCQYIVDPDEDFQLIMVRLKGWCLRYLDNPPEAVKLAALAQDGLVIKYIEAPTLQMQMVAVSQNDYAAYFIENIHPKVTEYLVNKRND